MSVEPKSIRLSTTGKIITIAIIVGLAILLVRTLGHVMTPFVAAAITAYLFNPLISWLNRRTHITRALWIFVLYICIGGLVYWLVQSLGPLIVSQYNELLLQIPRITDDITRQLSTNQTMTIAGLTIDVSAIEEPVIGFLSEAGRDISFSVPHLFVTAIESVLLFVTYLIVTFYMLYRADHIMSWLYGLVPAPYRDEIRGLGRQIDDVLSSYVRGTLLLIPIMSVLTYIALTFLNVEYALVIAIATGFLEVIPLIGPWSAAGIAMTVSLFQATAPFGWDNWVLAAVVGVTYFVLRMSEDNFIIPYVVGHAVHLHPVLVLFAILSGGVLGGAFGLLVSIPVVAIVRLLLRYVYHKLIDSPDLPSSDITTPPKPHNIIQSATKLSTKSAVSGSPTSEAPQTSGVGEGSSSA
ncbi:MAG: AI-2E family transporter [Chloroflexi bacterium AL-W]|nr:AI-2E family transporter [Chloroflexi bacterium AL-N1]NOK70801.1 AI-2E family transporter [Chloroflexi bacterium AL-N10]NOK78361.1 AI-2E family transporter [Chloroflexi bacterium AL-N5]NOK85342.1 AI-2E family transporter [Chloroflexi bacterium AL-W]NOK92618.1 AI-2E family transporter [Chloroflexi bacterium AL-N15]